jgi:hypothetical protein
MAASSKRIGFFWGDEKITLVEFDKNSPLQAISASLGSKPGTSSPFSSNLTEEIQITAVLKKILDDHQIKGGTFYVSLPMKEIILRSFAIPFVKSDNIQNAIKFEAKKYIPFDIQDLSYVFHTIPFMEGQNKRLQVIFFAARKEVLARYERIFQQVNAVVSYSEPYIVSLSKSLLYRKEIKPNDHVAFLILDKNLGRICFINKGIPQFIREFPVSSSLEESNDSAEVMNAKIVIEVANSFDFYSRQFSGEPIGQVLVSSDFVQPELMGMLEAELKLKILKFSPAINTGAINQINDMDAIYAMGACVVPPIESLSKFNFIEDRTPKSGFENDLAGAVKPYKEIIFALLVCVVFLIGIYVFLQMQLKLVQNQYDQLLMKEGAFASETQDGIQAEVQQNIDKLSQYKAIRTKTDISTIVLRVASHLPVGMLLTDLRVNYNQGDTNTAHVAIDMQGMVVNEDPNEQIAVVNQMFADLKSDKVLARFFSNGNLVSMNRQVTDGKQTTGFVIHFS